MGRVDWPFGTEARLARFVCAGRRLRIAHLDHTAAAALVLDVSPEYNCRSRYAGLTQRLLSLMSRLTSK
jgi:hypothetical protein